jgi:hypothetical protein
MPPRRRVDREAGRAALAAWSADPAAASVQTVATAVRFTLEELAARHPGSAVEIRVPPYGAVQCFPGTTHRRGTPPNVVEADAATWLNLATGRVTWSQALADARCSASGAAADLSEVLPLA